jgi:hypothetical protein
MATSSLGVTRLGGSPTQHTRRDLMAHASYKWPCIRGRPWSE